MQNLGRASLELQLSTLELAQPVSRSQVVLLDARSESLLITVHRLTR